MNPEHINELIQIMNQPKITKITNQATMHSAVRNKQYIVGSYNESGGISFNVAPVLHSLASQARAECKRLAKIYPGKTFLFVCLEGAEMTVPQPTTVSI
jgi:hypothetical protein